MSAPQVSYREWTLHPAQASAGPKWEISGPLYKRNDEPAVPVIERAALDAERAAHAQTKTQAAASEALLREAVGVVAVSGACHLSRSALECPRCAFLARPEVAAINKKVNRG